MQSKNKRLVAKKLQTPEFKSEADEARWYEKNQDVLLAEFKDAVKDGSMGRGSLRRMAVRSAKR